jgi:hypothetical protein
VISGLYCTNGSTTLRSNVVPEAMMNAKHFFLKKKGEWVKYTS